MTQSDRECLEEGNGRDIADEGLAEIMGGQDDSRMEEVTYELWGERDALAEQFFPSKIQVTEEDDVAMLDVEDDCNSPLARY